MTFSRYSDQCVDCACYLRNADPEAQALMDEAGIECSLEQPMEVESFCEFFQWAKD